MSRGRKGYCLQWREPKETLASLTIEVSPQVEEKVDRLLARLQRGEREGLQAELLPWRGSTLTNTSRCLA